MGRFTAWYMSRDGQVLKDGVTPDEYIDEEFDPEHPTEGETIEKALE